MPLVWRPEGYAAKAQQFQGILNHPQALGVLLAPFTAWLLVRVASGKSWQHVPLLSACLWLIYLSQARVALLGIGLGVGAALVGLAVRSIRDSRSRRESLVVTGAVLAVAACLVATITWSAGAREALLEFVLKPGTLAVNSVGDALLASRRDLIGQSWGNFVVHPIAGIGFGLPSQPSMLEVEELAGVPISAPREKGFLPTAVLEESGVLGGVLLLAFVVGLARTVARQRSLQSSTMFWSALCINLGEMVLFSPGGVGMYVWLMLGLAATPLSDSLANRLPFTWRAHSAMVGARWCGTDPHSVK
jgi:hypothetical protein